MIPSRDPEAEILKVLFGAKTVWLMKNSRQEDVPHFRLESTLNRIREQSKVL